MSTSLLRIARALLFAVTTNAFVASVSVAQASHPPISRDAFRSLRWLEGRWVGSGGGYSAFYEEYVFVNDSTIEQREHADSIFGTPRRVSTIAWRNGTVHKGRGDNIESRLVRIHGDSARFEPLAAGRRGFTWLRVGEGRWRAVLDGPAQPVVYDLRRAGAPSAASNAPGAPTARASLADDEAGVRRAALDYLEGFYEGDSTKHVRSVHPSVFKYGFSRSRATSEYRGSRMEWPEFHSFSRGVRERGAGAPPPNAPKEVRVYEVLDQTASAKVTAWWGIDYLLLAKFEGRWMITHVLWQSPPVSR